MTPVVWHKQSFSFSKRLPLPGSQTSCKLQVGAGLSSTVCYSRRRRRVLALSGVGLGVGLGLLAGVGVASAAMAGAASTDPQWLVRQGMDRFQKGDIGGSLESFDAALAVRPSLRPYLWQRGLSLYYLQQYEEAAQQFRDDVAVNPADTEESIWCFLSEAQLRGPDKARESFLQVGLDPRPVMRAAYKCFKDGSDPSAIVEAAAGDTVGHAAFYAWLYVGLWHEAQGDADAAQAAIGRAVQTDYARGSGDYMAALARVHLHQRGWA